MTGNCELCWREATHVDGSAVDLNRSTDGANGIVYRDMLLCGVHAAERRGQNTARVRVWTAIKKLESVINAPES